MSAASASRAVPLLKVSNQERERKEIHLIHLIYVFQKNPTFTHRALHDPGTWYLYAA